MAKLRDNTTVGGYTAMTVADIYQGKDGVTFDRPASANDLRETWEKAVSGWDLANGKLGKTENAASATYIKYGSSGIHPDGDNELNFWSSSTTLHHNYRVKSGSSTISTLKYYGGSINTGAIMQAGSFLKWDGTSVSYVGHGHSIANTSGLQDALNGKLGKTGGTSTGDIIIAKKNGRLVINELEHATGNSGIKFQANSSGQDITLLHEITNSDLLAGGGQALKIDGGAETAHLELQGSFYCGGSIFPTGIVHNAGYNDYAEYFEKGDDIYEPGDIVELDMDSENEEYIRTTKEGSLFAVGVVSDEYGHILGGGDHTEDFTPIALAGRVRAKVIGLVNKGDFIVSSHISGVGMVYVEGEHNPLAILGMATEGKSIESVGRVRILVK